MENIEKELYIHCFLNKYINSFSPDSVILYNIDDYNKYYRRFKEASPIAGQVPLSKPQTLKTHIQELNGKLRYLFHFYNNLATTSSRYPFANLYEEFFCRQLKYLLESGSYVDIFESLYKDVTIDCYKNSGKYRVNLQIDLNCWKVPAEFFLLYIALIGAAKQINFDWGGFRKNVQNILEQLITAQVYFDEGSFNKFNPCLVETKYDLSLLEEIYNYLLEYYFPDSMCDYLNEVNNYRYFGIPSTIAETQKSLLKNYRFPYPINTAVGIDRFYKKACEQIKLYFNKIKDGEFFNNNILQQLDNICFECAMLESKIYQEKVTPHMSSLSIENILVKCKTWPS